jgi:hypothetical protein
VQAQHSRLRELAARSQDPNIDEFERRRNMDQFAAAAAQHAAAVADVSLTASRTFSGGDAAALLDNLNSSSRRCGYSRAGRTVTRAF